MKKLKSFLEKDYLHLILIVVGIAFTAIGVFHSNIWFDEAYSVALAKHSFVEIWTIGGNDVHPILYYWILHVIYLATGGSLIAYRLFSLFCIACLGVLGFTHIRKDFGKRAGLMFSFFSYFLPDICIFASELRMYSLAILLVTILAIYGYRIYKGDTSIKNWVIFFISSLLCLYTHYYGLMAAGLINLIMFFNFIRLHRKESIRRIVISGIAQFVLYLPWLINFITQLKNVSSGFWISFEFPKSLYEIASYQFIGNIKEQYIGFAVSLVIYIFLIIKFVELKRKKVEVKPAGLAIGLYLAVIAAAYVITKIMGTAILYYRYLFVVTGLYIFFISFIVSKEKNKFIVTAICVVTLVLGIWSNSIMVKDNYSNLNSRPIEYMKNHISPGDCIVYKDMGTGSVAACFFPENKQYFYNNEKWGVEEAYKAFSSMKTCNDDSFLEELSGRIWVIDGNNNFCYNALFNNENYILESQEHFETEYKDYQYTITAVTKK